MTGRPYLRQKIKEQADRPPLPRTLIMDFTSTVLDDQMCTLLDNLITQDTQMVLLSLMVI